MINKRGIIELRNIKGIDFYYKGVTKEALNNTNVFIMHPRSITIHETDNTGSSADALHHARLLSRNAKVRWHFSVDEHCIIQHFPVIKNCWHAGDGENGVGNRSSIAIELCVNKGADFEKTKKNARVLVQYLMKELGIKEIQPHKHWSGKNCPKTIISGGWDSFVNFLHVKLSEENDWDSISEKIQMCQEILFECSIKIEKMREV